MILIMNIKKVFLLVLLLSGFFDFSFGQVKNIKPFNINFTRETIIFGTGAVGAVAAFAILNNVEPLTPQEISLLDPADINGFDRGAIGPFTEDHTGDIILYTAYLLPLTFLTYSETKNDLLDLTLMYGEILLIQASINGIVKGSVMRTRPFVYDDQTPIEEKTSKDARISFFSGHTSMTATVSFFTAKVFTEYIEDNTAKILIWSGAVLLPAVTAISRVNTHWHFPTDVLMGYAVGAFVGFIIPEMHKTKVSDSVSIYPMLNINRPALTVQIKF
jgi:membrane-associated phospholipid phosphatase